MRDTVAEMAERAHVISQEAGSKVAAAMKDVISAGAGIAGFAIESARDLVQYMVRRGQMTPEEADKLIREAEAAHDKRPASEKGRPTASKIAAERAAAAKAEAAARSAALAATAAPFRPAPRPAPAIASNGTRGPSVVKAPAKAEPVKSVAVKVSAKPVSKPEKQVKAAAKGVKVAAKSPPKGKGKATKSAAPKRGKGGGKR